MSMAYAYQFWQGEDMQLGVFFRNVTRYFDHMIFQGNVKYFSCCITITTRPKATKLGTVVT